MRVSAARREARLLALTVTAGWVDALSFLGLGRVFTSNMTGNTVLLGLALAQARGGEVQRSAVALGGFVLGAAVGSWLAGWGGPPGGWPARVTLALAAELVALAAFACLWSWGTHPPGTRLDLLVALAALGMGVQSVAARRLGIPGVTTTVVTSILAELVADVASLTHPRRWAPRLGFWGSLLAGAAAGAALELRWPALAAAVPALLVAAVILVALVAEGPFRGPGDADSGGTGSAGRTVGGLGPGPGAGAAPTGPAPGGSAGPAVVGLCARRGMSHADGRMERSPVVAVLALILVGAVACVPFAPLGHASSPLARFYQQRLSWHACSGGECAHLQVPLDYGRPSGRTISVAVIRIPASDRRGRVGALVLNPGGPGASGIEYAREAARVFPASLRARFDLVGFDPRGVGESAPIDCVGDAQLDALTGEPAYPVNAEQQSQLVSRAQALARACGRRDGSLLDHVSSADVARDLDVLRAALGEPRLTYYGASYGTFLGVLYEERFPGRIRAMVLDSALDPALGSEQEDLQQAQSFDHLLGDFLAWCVARPDCALGNTEAAARDRLQALIQQVAQQPLPGRGGRLVGTGPLLTALAAAMYSPADGFPVLNVALRLGLAGNGALLLALADDLNGRGPDGHYSNLIEANYAVNCVDRPHPTSVQALAAEAERAPSVAPLFGAAIVWSDLPCVFWPASPELTPRPAPPSRTPILVVATRDDPATPYQWGASLTRELKEARLLTFAGEGHVAFGRGDACVDAAVVAYLTAATLPAPGATCPA
jgi:uncharacterized membrane protein YoaK (UPF0700 family)/pimeloyl-ACP methyl ester carboxylesterase